MADEISKLLKNSKAYNKYSEVGYEYSKEFLVDNVKKKWLKLIKEKYMTKGSIFELKTKDPSQMTGLSQMYGSGMIVVNPPYQLKEKMQAVLPEPPAGAGA